MSNKWVPSSCTPHQESVRRAENNLADHVQWLMQAADILNGIRSCPNAHWISDQEWACTEGCDCQETLSPTYHNDSVWRAVEAVFARATEKQWPGFESA